MRKFGLIGYPLNHSFSKKYFTDKFEKEGIRDCLYENYPISGIELLPDLLNSDNSIVGLNVTIPYKTRVMKYLDFINNEASQVGAVNVLKIKRSDGKMFLSGYNSDITGIRDTLKPYVSSSLKNAMILGTGGSSRAVSYVLEQLNINYLLVSRTEKENSVTYDDITPEIYQKTQLIVNTTPLGMYPNVADKPPINYNMLHEKHILIDLIYNPEKTTFLSLGEKRGCSVINGLKMLYSQAEKSWEIWNDDSF